MLQITFLLIVISTCAFGHVANDIPPELRQCVESLMLKASPEMTSESAGVTSPDEIMMLCMRQFLWKPDTVDWSVFNITQEDMDMINSHLESVVLHSRTKRHAKKMPKKAGPAMPPAVPMPRTGFRIRQEYRRLTDWQRAAFHKAVNVLKSNGEYDAFVRLHRGIVISSAHNGPNFLGWHRVYLALFEEALRLVNKFVTLPYWDSSLDYHMNEPTDSIIWSPPFFGNGDGFVTSGPFAKWPTEVGPLTRNIGGTSRLISKQIIASILSGCRTVDIITPTAHPNANLEFAHNGVHRWVGGQMAGLNTSPMDPIFFLHHAFIDYLWELFRIRQAKKCGINPATDYPDTPGHHNADRPMDTFPYRNIDGYANFWTQYWYRYERSPSCSPFNQNCGSQYLSCDKKRWICISITRPFMMKKPGGYGAMSRLRAAQDETTIFVGPKFNGPPSDPRSADVALAKGGPKF